MSKKLKINDRVVVQFLGAKYDSRVVAIRPDYHYDIRTSTGTIIPNCTWQKYAHKKAPWWIFSKIDEGAVAPVDPVIPDVLPKSKDITKLDLDAKIKEQKDFIRGKHKK